jgi:trehalose/maltose transport system substrate-binding protein
MAYLRRTRENRISGSCLSRVRRFAHGGVCVLVFFVMQACHKTSPSEPVTTVTLMQQAWLISGYQRGPNGALARFTRQTGIRVELIPAPETATATLANYRKLLEAGANVPDVYGIEVIWPAILADNLLDLSPYIPDQEIRAHFPELIANYRVNGQLVALPDDLSEGMLFYRVDLLREYGYRAPPKTWEELEVMARRIQSGERANGNKDFWGFVWQGAPSESLTSNALEWQVSEGGETILDETGKVTVNNPHTIRAWERAARWVGSISPPGVVVFTEWDAANMWHAGKAAFMRSWASEYVFDRSPDSQVKDRFDIAPLPSGAAGIAGTLGGAGYGISRHSLHPREAAMLVRFLCSRDEQVIRSRNLTDAPSISQLYDEPELLVSNPQFPRVLGVFRRGIVLRPSRAAGKMYPDVSRAYWEAVHAVLTRKKSAAQAADELQDELERILKTPTVHANSEFGKTAAQR